MRLSDWPTRAIGAVPQEYEPQRWIIILRSLEQALGDISRVVGGELTFGDGINADSLKGQWIEFTSSSTPGAENTIPHTLGAVPVGFILMVPPASGTVNKGSTAWTTSNVYLTCSAASQTVKIFLLAPPV